MKKRNKEWCPAVLYNDSRSILLTLQAWSMIVLAVELRGETSLFYPWWLEVLRFSFQKLQVFSIIKLVKYCILSVHTRQYGLGIGCMLCSLPCVVHNIPSNFTECCMAAPPHVLGVRCDRKEMGENTGLAVHAWCSAVCMSTQL